MNLSLYPHQESIITSTRLAMRRSRSVLIQAPTGFGKTVIATFIANSVIGKQKRLYFICHRQELILQTAKTFAKNGIDVSYIASGYHYNPMCLVQICSIDTLKNRYKRLPAPDVCIWDEAHHLGAAGWSRVKDYYSQSFHVGLSATPQRLDGKGLSQWFDEMVIEVSVRELIELGYLSDYKMFAPSKPDMSGVKIVRGDYSVAEMAAVMDNADLTGDIVKHWLKHARGKKTVLFAVNIEHSMHIVDTFNRQGIKALHLDGNTPKEKRREACLSFARGEYDIISNVALFGEGFDLSAQTDIDVTIECVICARKTASLALWLQMCGRALRMKDFPAIILDHAGNATNPLLGLPCQDREWTLEGNPKQGKKTDENEVPIKECPKCYAVHRPLPSCPNCGHVYEVKRREIEHVEGELEELSKEAIRKQARVEQGTTHSIQGLVALGKKRGYKNPAAWAAHVYTARLAKESQR